MLINDHLRSLRAGTYDTAGGGAPGGGAAVVPPAAPTAAAGAPAGGETNAGGDPWYQPHIGSFDKDTLAYLDGHKFRSLSDALKSGMHAERMAKERNVIKAPDPEKLGEWEGWRALGYDPDRGRYGAKIKPPKMPNDGKHDAELFDAMVTAAHKRQVPPALVEGLIQDMTDFVTARLSKAASDGIKATEEFETALRAEWGSRYDQKMELGRRAAKAFGIGADNSAELERIFGDGNANKGAVRLAKFFADLGSKLGEGNLVSADGMGGASQTPAAAQAELRRLEADPQWVKIFRDRRHPQNADYTAQWKRLTEIAAKDPTALRQNRR